jgi:formamidopyrimidine-DNA glycosylase
MPELPEVETVVLEINHKAIGKGVVNVWQSGHKLRGKDVTFDHHHIEQSILVGCRRRGKYLLLDFSTGTLILHLGMSGRISIASHALSSLKHEHLRIIFHCGTQLSFTDPRRFGMVAFTSSGQNPDLHPLLEKLGVEPLSSHFNPAILLSLCKQSRSPIKPFLMQSHTIVGIGNIYASEALFEAGINPMQPANTLSPQQCEKLYASVVAVLNRAIASGGSSLRDYARTSGEKGYFQHQFKVYDRTDQPCNQCSTNIAKIIQGQRSTFFCPRCQQ